MNFMIQSGHKFLKTQKTSFLPSYNQTLKKEWHQRRLFNTVGLKMRHKSKQVNMY